MLVVSQAYLQCAPNIIKAQFWNNASIIQKFTLLLAEYSAQSSLHLTHLDDDVSFDLLR